MVQVTSGQVKVVIIQTLLRLIIPNTYPKFLIHRCEGLEDILKMIEVQVEFKTT